jgi:hypothetical protein
LIPFVVVNHMLHSAARWPKGLGWRYEAHLRGLELCNINLPTTDFDPFVGHFSPSRAKNDQQKKKVPCCRRLEVPFA